MTLSIAKINSIKPGLKNQKLADAQGLYLFVPGAIPVNNKTAQPRRMAWRFDYRYAGKRYTLSLGTYPVVGLAEARNRHHAARRLLECNENPAQVKRQEKLVRFSANANSFESVANAWYESKQARRSKTWRDTNSLYLKRNLLPKIGPMPITEVSKAMLVSLLESAKKSHSLKTVDRIRQTAVQVFDYAIRKSKSEANPARLIKGWEEIPAPESHAPLLGAKIPEYLERVDAYAGEMATKICMKLLMLTFVRKRELTEAKWSEFDLAKASWLIPAERMKMESPHLVPLSRQSVEALKQLKHLTEHSKYAFPSTVSDEKPMSSSTLNVAFKNIGYGGTLSPHGVRTTASTWLNNQGFRGDVVERQLAHTERNRIRAIYNNATYIEERITMMQAWADFVDPQS